MILVTAILGCASFLGFWCERLSAPCEPFGFIMRAMLRCLRNTVRVEKLRAHATWGGRLCSHACMQASRRQRSGPAVHGAWQGLSVSLLCE